MKTISLRLLLSLPFNFILHHVISLSSHSPQDLLAYPKYIVGLADWNSAILNSTATTILTKNAPEDPSSKPITDGALMVLDGSEAEPTNVR